MIIPTLPKSDFEKTYDKYSTMVYSLALEASGNKTHAEEITVSTFKTLNEQKMVELNSHSLCATLIKLTIQTAHKKLKPHALKHNFKFKFFENTPLLQQLLCEQISMDDCCKHNKLTRIDIALKLRQEFASIHTTKSQILDN